MARKRPGADQTSEDNWAIVKRGRDWLFVDSRTGEVLGHCKGVEGLAAATAECGFILTPEGERLVGERRD